MKTLRLVFEDHLSSSISSLSDCDKTEDIIFMTEATPTMLAVKHHKKKIAFLFSAMRHFAKELKEKNYNILYEKINKEAINIPYKDKISQLIKEHNITKIVLTEPSSYKLLEEIKTYGTVLKVPVEIRIDDRFLSSIEHFKQWSKDRKSFSFIFIIGN